MNAIDEVISKHRSMLDDEVRADEARWQPLVHPDYFMFGYGGSEVGFDQLGEHLKPLKGQVEFEVCSCEQLSDDVVLLLWRGTAPWGVVNRSAVWVKTDEGWKLRYQQGTKVSDTPDD